MRRVRPKWITPFAVAWALQLLAAQTQPPRGGVLRVAERAEPKTFNPVVAVDAPSRDILRRIHADLISIDRGTQSVVPALAESWTRFDGGLRYRLKLRKNLLFSDGEPFTADDVVFSFALYLDEKLKSPQRDLLLIDDHPIECLKIDNSTVEFRLPAPYAAAERLFDSIAILPKHRLEAMWRNGTLQDAWSVAARPEDVAGLGPFRLKSYIPGDRVVLERNPYYWKNPLPYLDGIEFRFLADEDAQLAHFVAGDIDVLSRLNSNAIEYLQSKRAALEDVGPSLEFNFLCFNLSPNSPKLALFSRAEFRRALALAVDRAAMARTLYKGRATPIWSSETPGNKLWYSGELPRPARDLEAARRLLSRAGLTNQSMEFSILVSASSPERVQMATMLQADWKEIGVNVNIVTLEFRAMLDRVLKTRQFDSCVLGLGGGDSDPNAEMNLWLSSGGTHLWNPNQSRPETSWEAEIDSLMRKQMITLDYRERKRLYDRVQTIVADQAPMIFLISPHVVVAQRGTVGNFRPAVLDHPTLWNADQLFLMRQGARQ